MKREVKYKGEIKQGQTNWVGQLSLLLQQIQRLLDQILLSRAFPRLTIGTKGKNKERHAPHRVDHSKK